VCEPSLEIDKKLCTRCGLCVEACQCGTLVMEDDGPVVRPVHEQATLPAVPCPCDCLCEEVCPTGAINCVFEIVMSSDGNIRRCLCNDEAPRAERRKE